MTPETTVNTEVTPEVVEVANDTPSSGLPEAQGKQLSAKNMARLEKRVNIVRRNREIQPLIAQYTEELAPVTKRQIKLVERIAALQLQVNQGFNIEPTKVTMSRLIRRVLKRG